MAMSTRISTHARRIAAWSIYPLLMGASLCGLYLALERGVTPEVALVAVNVTATAMVILLERVTPHRRSWNRSHGDLVTDALHGLVNLLCVPALLQALVLASVMRASASVEMSLGVRLWPDGWPIPVQLALALLLAELGQYWLHRLMHERALLWRLHAVHHSAPRLYWLNALRLHPLDALASYAVGLVLLVFLGVPAGVLTLYMVYAGVHATLQHANLEMRLGPLDWVLSHAVLHRFHHAPERAVSNCNYGAVLIVWDVLFGTRYLPRDRESPARPGIEDMPEYPRGYLGQLAAPFRGHGRAGGAAS